ncbi:CsbD family protein [Roseimaritima ulvae]|uniref:CsbD-like domain-containing protein n=1 Tax=Roseimaritima ulvae TaxID=980254 RepID=A0A5B9QVR1_9BACT|nr:CsbD family protein [Roseimaritima ulvae]QEG41880.1 hypothetical protein UC8_39080 [Roseimaritima ulvae]
MTTKQELSGKWKSIAGAVKKKYGAITDNDLRRAEGDLNQLAGLIQQKTGQSREQIEAFFDECCASNDSLAGQAQQLASGATESLREGYSQATEQARRGYESTVKTMSRHPLESTGAALGLGLIVGVLVGLSIGAQRERDLAWHQRWGR